MVKALHQFIHIQILDPSRAHDLEKFGGNAVMGSLDGLIEIQILQSGETQFADVLGGHVLHTQVDQFVQADILEAQGSDAMHEFRCDVVQAHLLQLGQGDAVDAQPTQFCCQAGAFVGRITCSSNPGRVHPGRWHLGFGCAGSQGL